VATYARTFVRPDSEVNCNNGTTGLEWGGGSSIAAIIKTTDVTNTKVIAAFGPAGSNAWTFQVDADESVALFTEAVGGKRNSAASRIVSGRWHLACVTKATGTSTPRFHIYDYTTQSWVHENGGGTQADLGAIGATSAVWIGQDNDSAGNGWDGQMQALGYWSSALSDAAVENLVSSRTAWEQSTPAAFWPLTQSSTGTAVQDTIGTADEVSTTGTSVTTGLEAWDDLTATYPAAVMAQSPAIYYRLDEPFGDMVDRSGNARNATVASGVTRKATSLLPSDGDQAITMNATASSRCSSSYNCFTPGGSNTFVGIARLDDISTYRVFWGGSGVNAPELYYDVAGNNINWDANFGTAVGWSFASTGITLGVNFHVAIVYTDVDPCPASLYINGQQIGTTQNVGIANGYNGSAGNRGNFTVGDSGVPNNAPFYGGLDEVAVWNSALSGATILSLATAAGFVATTGPSDRTLIVNAAPRLR